MHRSFLIFGIGFMALMAGVLFYAARAPLQQQPAAEAITLPAGPVYPEFELPDLDGVERELAEWRGKVTLLNFWATWCAPCRREIPLLKSFQAEQGGNGIQVIGIAVDFPDMVARYAETAEFNYPVVVGQEDAMAVAETSGIEFMGMPFTMIVAADGEYLSAHIGEIVETDLEHIVEVIGQLENGEIDTAAARAALDRL